MKILAVAPYYHPYTSGMTVYLKRLLEGLARKGHDVSILTAKHDDSLPSFEVAGGVSVHRTSVAFRMQRGAFSPALLLRFAGMAGSYDAINIHAPFFEAGPLVLIAKLSGRRVFLTYHCDLRMKDGLASKTVEGAYYLSVGLAARLSEKVAVNSLEYVKSSRIRAHEGKAVRIFPPIDADWFVKSDAQTFKDRFGLKGGPVIGFVGRLVFEKGIRYLLEAMPMIKEKFPGAQLVIAGEDSRIAGGAGESVKSEALSIIERLKLEGIVFTGHLSDDDLRRFYSACDVFVLPSIDPLESFGMVQVEAMLCGTPVVASDMPGIREPVKLTGMGMLVPPADARSLADATVKVISARESLVVPRKEIESLFNASNTVSEYEGLFKG